MHGNSKFRASFRVTFAKAICDLIFLVLVVTYASYCTDCPPEVTITPSDGGTMAVGQTLTCTSDSALATYSFTDSDGTVTDGKTVTLIEDGSFSFTCTATVAMDTPCSATASVSGTAVGKKQSSNDHCWCITNCLSKTVLFRN